VADGEDNRLAKKWKPEVNYHDQAHKYKRFSFINLSLCHIYCRTDQLIIHGLTHSMRNINRKFKQ